MTRRSTLRGIFMGLLTGFGLSKAQASAEDIVQGRYGSQFDITALKAMIEYPVEEVPGHKAMSRWRKLRASSQGYPVIIGGPEELSQFADMLSFQDRPAPEEAIAAGEAIDFPKSFLEQKRAELLRYLEQYPDSGTLEEFEPEVGEWPDAVSPAPELTVHADILSGKPYGRCFIVTFPTEKGHEVPAYANWGGWNANPSPAMHVAALKSWEERYGVELVGMSGDVLNLVATRRPATREEAMGLAREHYAYCEDIVTQGVGTLAALAAAYMESDWWYFWWD